MSEILAEHAAKAMAWLESGAAWIAGEIPVYVEEVLRWSAARNTVLMCVYGFLAVLGLFLIIIGLRAAVKDSLDDQSVVMICIGILMEFFSIGVIYHMLELIKINVAPRVYMIEYLSDLIN